MPVASLLPASGLAIGIVTVVVVGGGFAVLGVTASNTPPSSPRFSQTTVLPASRRQPVPVVGALQHLELVRAQLVHQRALLRDAAAPASEGVLQTPFTGDGARVIGLELGDALLGLEAGDDSGGARALAAAITQLTGSEEASV